jgi:DNA polymerase-3 subunit gamma/tau
VQPAPEPVAEPVPEPLAEPVAGPVAEPVAAPVERASPPVVEPPAAPPGPATTFSLVDVRRIWPDLLEKVREMRRYTWILLSQNAQVIGLEADVLTVGFKNAGARDSFIGGGSEEILRQAAIDVIGVDWKVEAIVDPSADPGAGTAPRVTKPAVESTPDLADTSDLSEPAVAPQVRATAQPEAIASVRSNIAQTRTGERPAKQADERDAGVDPDDPDADDSGLDGAELLQRELGATVIDEIPHE